MNKTLTMMVTAGIMLVVIGLILSIGGKIQTETKENVATVTTNTYNNESVVASGISVSLTCRGDADSPANTGINSVFNGSNLPNDLICMDDCDGTVGNYTLNSQAGSINFTVGEGGYEASGNNFTVTYTCSGYDLVWAIGVNSTESVTNLSTWTPTIAVIVAAIVIITLLFVSFGVWIFRQGKEG